MAPLIGTPAGAGSREKEAIRESAWTQRASLGMLIKIVLLGILNQMVLTRACPFFFFFLLVFFSGWLRALYGALSRMVQCREALVYTGWIYHVPSLSPRFFWLIHDVAALSFSQSPPIPVFSSGMSSLTSHAPDYLIRWSLDPDTIQVLRTHYCYHCQE